MNICTDRGRSVTVKKGLSLMLGITTAAAVFLCPARVSALENRTPITAVPVTDRTMLDVTPLEAEPVEFSMKAPLYAGSLDLPMPVAMEAPEAEEAAAEETEAAKPRVNDYLGFSRTDLVNYLVTHADEYLGTPFGDDAYACPTPGTNLQSEGFVWSVMYNVATENRDDVPCGSAVTAPAGNGGGWVNWAYYHDIEPLTFDSKEEMLASGKLEKGDVIWSFDTAGPYGLSNANHIGFFWGDDPSDDVFWQSGVQNSPVIYAGSAQCNRITPIESVAAVPSVWWVFKLSHDPEWDGSAWAGLPEMDRSGAAAEADADAEDREKEEELSEETSEQAEDPVEEEIPAEPSDGQFQPETLPEDENKEPETAKPSSEGETYSVNEAEKEIIFYEG